MNPEPYETASLFCCGISLNSLGMPNLSNISSGMGNPLKLYDCPFDTSFVAVILTTAGADLSTRIDMFPGKAAERLTPTINTKIRVSFL